MKKTLICLAVASAVTLPAAALAQTPEMATYTVLGQSVADDSAAPVAVQQTAQGVHYNTVSSKAIKAQNAQDFNSTLRNVPGVMSASMTMLGVQTSASLYIRGRGASHPSPDLQLLFDGVPRMGALYGQTYADAISVNMIDSIDIFKSPAPSEFGSGYAMVNVTPRRMTEEGAMAEVGLSGGSYSSWNQTLTAGYKSGAFDILASQNWVSTDGHRDHSRAQQAGYYLNMGYALTPNWEVRLMSTYTDAQTLEPLKLGAIAYGQADRYDTESSLTTLSLNNNFDRAHGYVKLYWSDTDFKMHGDGKGKALGHQDVTLFGLRARETYQPTDATDVTLGIDLDRQDLCNTQTFYATGAQKQWDFPDITIISPYVSVTHQFGSDEGWHVAPSAGLRYYNNNEFGNEWAPQASLRMGYADTDVTLSYARGVNYPSPVVLQNLVGNNVSSNQWNDLEPELVDHYEITATHSFGDVADVSVSGFYDRGKNRFRAYMGGPLPNKYDWNDRTGRYTIKGLELAANVRPMDSLRLFASGTWMHVQAKDKNGTHTSMPYTPKFMLQAGSEWSPFKDATIYADIQHFHDVYDGVSMRPSPNFKTNTYIKLKDITLVNLRMSYAFRAPEMHLADSEAFVAINNLFDADYAWRDGYPMPGLTAMVGVNLKFK